MKPSSLLTSFLFVASVAAPALYAQSASTAAANPNDAKSCSDSQAVPRLPNSTLTGCNSKPDASVQMPTGKDASGVPTQKPVAGESQQWAYSAPKEMTADQVFTGVETILKNAGFTVVFEDSPKLLTATKQAMWCEVQISGSSYAQTIVNSPQPEPANSDGSLTVDVLNRGGRVPVKGIHFDAQGAIVSGSDAALSQIAALLTHDPTLKLRVEAYAFNGADPSSNLFLSQKEALAVVDWLAAHGVDKNRLSPQGLGATTPIEEAENGGKTATNHEIDIVKVQ
jgi:outer membrane protein OmpA-like peptidoglycan-associated protein